MHKAVLIHSPQLEQYEYPPDHPFSTLRAKKMRKLIESMGLLSGDNVVELGPEAASEAMLEKFHTARYLKALRAVSDGHPDAEAIAMGIGSTDCPVFEGLYDYAALATGGTILGASLVMDGKTQIAFNPSGGYHHAAPERAAGFCYIDDVALACEVLAEAGMKVLYLDVDVHHGDGVAYGFYDRSDVMTISLHENPRILFPGTGFEDEIGRSQGEGYCVNIPLPVGTFDLMYMKAFEDLVLPLVKAYDPDVFVFELGADGLAGDPLAHLQLTNNTYADVIDHLLSFDKPILATGGGGYDIENTVRAWSLAWSIFSDAEDTHDMSVGMGGVYLQSTEWEGGLRDRELPVAGPQRAFVAETIEATTRNVKRNVFHYHGL
jgi:acetoin utilization protein AcuC